MNKFSIYNMIYKKNNYNILIVNLSNLFEFIDNLNSSHKFAVQITIYYLFQTAITVKVRKHLCLFYVYFIKRKQ